MTTFVATMEKEIAHLNLNDPFVVLRFVGLCLQFTEQFKDSSGDFPPDEVGELLKEIRATCLEIRLRAAQESLEVLLSPPESLLNTLWESGHTLRLCLLALYDLKDRGNLPRLEAVLA